MPSNLLLTKSSYFFVFLFKYNETIIKQPSSCSLGKKVVKNCKILENKKSVLSSPSPLTSLGKFWSFRVTRQCRIRWDKLFP